MGHDHRVIVAIKSTSPPDQTARDFRAKSSLKTNVLSCFLLTLDRIVKELSNFKARSMVLRDPPAFRLDCDPIGAGLITNFHQILSNFPLERQTSARKKSSN